MIDSWPEINAGDEGPPLFTLTKRGWLVLGIIIGAVATALMIIAWQASSNVNPETGKPFHVTADCSDLDVP